LSTLVTGAETWIHHFEPEMKRQSMEWHHTTSPRKKKFKAIPSASKIMATVFWDSEGTCCPEEKKINSDVYMETLKKLKNRFRRVRPHKDVTNVLLHCDHARPHTSLHTREAIKKLQWTVLPHPPYSPDLARSDYHLFSPLKDAIRGKNFEDGEEIISEVKRWLRQRPAEWYREGIQTLTSRWRKATDSEGDHIEK
jgi:histone-lysine N-methyltransferase SETMAR